MSATELPSTPKRMSGGMTWLFAIVGGAAVGNLYWAQPLLATIAKSLGVPIGSAGALVTMTQIGYALGIVLIVPLGDVMVRRTLIPVVMFVSALALLATALAPSYTTLLAALTAVGLTTVAGQLLIPLASDLSSPEERGRTVGTIVGGILIGILLSRTVSGVIADAFGWRTVYFLAAATTASFSVLLTRVLPSENERPRIAYGLLLASVPAVVRKHRSVQVTLAIGTIGFCTFTMFWTGLTFLLSAPPFSYSLSQIGLMGVVGLAGSLAARRVGWLHDNGYSAAGTGAALFLAFVSLGIGAAGSASIIPVAVAVLLFDVAIQGNNVLNQTRLFSVEPEARSRLNTAFVSCNFLGGAVGSLLAGFLWELDGWTAIMSGAMALVGVAFLLWVAQRRHIHVSHARKA
ncbi:MFS transporter [Rhizobium sp. NPDC090275]|uniref:MFS transporter n=1 Tax=Rhizobium sp. NPDC090275 TaxID=3364498 RepID=UPI00383A13DA